VTFSAGAIGTIQVMPSSGESASQLVRRPLDLRNAQDNVIAGVVRTSTSLEISIAPYFQRQYPMMNRRDDEDTKDCRLRPEAPEELRLRGPGRELSGPSLCPR
jgi:hypothetical protein